MPYITEGNMIDSLKSAMDTVIDFKNKIFKPKKNAGGANYLDRSSISKASKDLIASFPVICSNTISPPVASMVSKALERNDVMMLQMLFSSAYLSGSSGREVLAQWHKNFDNSYNMDDVVDLINNYEESAKTLTEAEANQIYREMKPIIESYIQSAQEFYPESSFSDVSINAYFVTETANGDIDIKKDMSALNEARGDDWDPRGQSVPAANGYYRDTISAAKFDYERNRDRSRDDAQRFKDRRDRAESQRQFNTRMNQDKAKFDFDKQRYDKDSAYRAQVDADKAAFEKEKFQYAQGKDATELSMARQRMSRDAMRDEHEFFSRQLLSSDAKKFNELVPSLLVIRFQAKDPDSRDDHRVEGQCIIGVKTRLIPVDSFDIIDHIRSVEKNKVSLVNFVRATTKEISFARDFVGAIDQAKIDAKQNSRLAKGSPIWRTLQSRSSKSVLNRLRKNRANDAGAITSLVMTMEEVNALRKEYDINLNIPAKAQYIMEQYNLLAFVIVDESVEVARFLYDGERYYQDLAFSSLERETSDSSYKKVINLISSINRG